MAIVKTILTKKMTNGLFKDLVTREYMSFVDWDTAVEWVEDINQRSFIGYTILQIEDIETDESRCYSL